MKSLILIVIVLMLSSITLEKCEKLTDDRIVWSSNRKLTWKDYKGKPIKDDTYKAMTYVDIDYNLEETEHSYDFNIPCYFIPELSWSKSKNQSSQWLLKHEQLHFDIAELHARKIRKSLSSHKSYSGEKTTKYLDSINTLYYREELLAMNIAYDEETEHGTIRDKQKEWEKRIEKELHKLRKYADTKVEVRRIMVLNN